MMFLALSIKAWATTTPNAICFAMLRIAERAFVELLIYFVIHFRIKQADMTTKCVLCSGKV